MRQTPLFGHSAWKHFDFPEISKNFAPRSSSPLFKLLTFKWTGFENSDEVDAFYKINKAKNWGEFKSGLKEFGVPAQNFIYADTSGNIGYKAAGKIPIRKTENKNDYIYPSHSNMEWTGFTDFNELPETYNPKQGYIVTANTNPFDWLKGEK